MNSLNSALKRQAAVALIGPRQVGKTTLVLELSAGVILPVTILNPIAGTLCIRDMSATP
jgi:predicted AAA+ superfamily ATPase